MILDQQWLLYLTKTIPMITQQVKCTVHILELKNFPCDVVSENLPKAWNIQLKLNVYQKKRNLFNFYSNEKKTHFTKRNCV